MDPVIRRGTSRKRFHCLRNTEAHMKNTTLAALVVFVLLVAGGGYFVGGLSATNAALRADKYRLPSDQLRLPYDPYSPLYRPYEPQRNRTYICPYCKGCISFPNGSTGDVFKSTGAAK